MTELKNLFSPIKIGSLELKNRVANAALGLGVTEEDGRLSQRYMDWILGLAKGGVGLIAVAGFETSKAYVSGRLAIGDDRFIPGLRELAEAIHPYGTKIAAHIGTTYLFAKDANSPLEVVGPSEGYNNVARETVRPLLIDEIHQMVEEYAEGARRARDAGFDAVEFHPGMGYELLRWLSPVTNKRTDEYGGSMENRMRIFLEILESTRRKVGRDFPIISRTSVEDYKGEGSLTIEDWKIMAPILEKAGVDMFNVQVGWHDSHTLMVAPGVPQGDLADLAYEIKKVVKNPVMVSHRIQDPLVAERIIAEGKADLVSVGRALMADPEWCNKAKEGRFDEIRYCIVCNTCLSTLGGYGLPTRPRERWVCDVNARYCNEGRTELKPVAKSRKILVIGGGPAGMEAAITAATRGHRVTLYDRRDKLGGQLLIATLTPYKDEIKQFTRSLTTMVKKAGVKVELNTEVDAPLVLGNKPDAVIVATGSKVLIPDIPGVDGENVVTFEEVLTEAVKVGNKVVVIGGGRVGCETADFLVAKGKEITILEKLERIATEHIIPINRADLMRRLRQGNVLMETKVMVQEITAEGVRATQEGNPIFYRADTVVLATGFSPNLELFTQLRDKVPEMYYIGDCVEPRKIRYAIAEGFSAGYEV